MTRSTSTPVYFSIDVEASGPVPALYNLVSIGAVPVTYRGSTWEPEEDRFYVELKPLFRGFDPDSMAVHGISREHLERKGAPPLEAMQRLTRFVEKRVRPVRGRAIFVGHNAVFDWAYINYYYEFHYLPNPFGYKALELKSFAMGCLGIDWLDSNKERLQELLPAIPPQDASLVHRADYDALYQAQILCALLNRSSSA
jgi:DNA polymerase III epsilon subunit-like protein